LGSYPGGLSASQIVFPGDTSGETKFISAEFITSRTTCHPYIVTVTEITAFGLQSSVVSTTEGTGYYDIVPTDITLNAVYEFNLVGTIRHRGLNIDSVSVSSLTLTVGCPHDFIT